MILALSAVTHDIGCIVNRKKHNEISVRILGRPCFNFLRTYIGPLIYRALTQTIVAHSSKYKLKNVPEDPCPEIRLSFICTIFRLADACDLSGSRVKGLLLQVLIDEKAIKKKSEDIWHSHLNVENINIVGTTIKLNYYNQRKAQYCLDCLEKELRPINAQLKRLQYPPFVFQPRKVKRGVLVN